MTYIFTICANTTVHYTIICHTDDIYSSCWWFRTAVSVDRLRDNSSSRLLIKTWLILTIALKLWRWPAFTGTWWVDTPKPQEIETRFELTHHTSARQRARSFLSTSGYWIPNINQSLNTWGKILRVTLWWQMSQYLEYNLNWFAIWWCEGEM